MKPGLYTKSLLTIGAVLLSVVAALPSTNPFNPVVHAAGPVVYRYTYMQLPFDVSEPGPGLENIANQLGEFSQKGWELVAAFPVAQSRNDNIATGTKAMVAILRKPK
jgi:hypothetical protein